MLAYAYQAALLCEDCGKAHVDTLRSRGIEDTGDSDDFPQGPYGDGGGEADTPQHCDWCNKFLENPLTDYGADYVRLAIEDHNMTGRGSGYVIKAWGAFYGHDVTTLRDKD